MCIFTIACPISYEKWVQREKCLDLTPRTLTPKRVYHVHSNCVSCLYTGRYESSSDFFHFILCLDVKKDKLPRQQAITIYQRVILQFIFTSYNIKYCIFSGANWATKATRGSTYIILKLHNVNIHCVVNR